MIYYSNLKTFVCTMLLIAGQSLANHHSSDLFRIKISSNKSDIDGLYVSVNDRFPTAGSVFTKASKATNFTLAAGTNALVAMLDDGLNPLTAEQGSIGGYFFGGRVFFATPVQQAGSGNSIAVVNCTVEIPGNALHCAAQGNELVYGCRTQPIAAPHPGHGWYITASNAPPFKEWCDAMTLTAVFVK